MDYVDYYKILGVSKDASQDKIQRAYRKLARKFHPDVNKDNGAEDQFKKINEANAVLKDPEKRKLYDAYGKNWQQGGFQQPPNGKQDFRKQSGAENFSSSFKYSRDTSHNEDDGFSDFFNSLFGGGFDTSQSNYRGFDRPGRSHEAEITVSLADVYHGSTKSISLQSYESDQAGQIRPTTRTLQVKIPKGVTNGSVIRLAGQGEEGAGTGVTGDLLLKINIAPDSRFRVDGHNLHSVVAVTPWEAALGTKVPIQTVEGSVTLTIPKGSQNHRKLRLRGKGIPKRSGTQGDIIIELEIRIPDKLTSAEEKLLEELSRESKFNPREKRHQRAGSHG